MSYLREVERLDDGSLPSINPLRNTRAVAWESTPARADEERHFRARTTTTSARVEHGHYPRAPSPTHTRHVEMQEQIRVYKDELAKKERLIAQLTSLETPRPAGVDITVIEDSYSADRTREIVILKSDIAALSVKVESIQSQNRDLQVQVDVREEKMKEMRIHLEQSRESEAKANAIALTLKQRLSEFEIAHGSLEGNATRSELAISTLQKDNLQLQERIADLESRIRHQSEEYSRHTTDIRVTEARYAEFVSKISSIVGYEEGNADFISSKLTEIIQDNALLKGKISSMKEYLSNAELETKASRETIMRLVSESEKEQHNTNRFTLEMDALRTERDHAVAIERELRREVDMLKERLETSSRAVAASRRDLEEREARAAAISTEIRTHELAARTMEAQFTTFRSSLSTLLSVQPHEAAIHDKVQALVISSRDRHSYDDSNRVTLSRSTSPMRWPGEDMYGPRARSSSPSRALHGALHEGRRSHSRSLTRYTDDPHVDMRARSVSPHGRGMRSISPHGRGMRSVSNDGRAIMSVSNDGRAMISVSPQGRGMRSVSPHGQRMRSVSPHGRAMRSVSPHGQRMRSVSPHGRAMRSVSPHGQRMRSVSPHVRAMRSVSPRGQRMRSVSPHAGAIRHESPYRQNPHSEMAPGQLPSELQFGVFETRIAELSSQLNAQLEISRSADMNGRRAEEDVISLQESLRRAEGELAAGEAMRDNMRMDKERYLRFLERISTALGMDPLTADLCLDTIVDAILVRSEQLMRSEHDQLVDRKTHIYNLQRKVKAMKEQLESKDLHMDLLRKKVAALEERLVGKSESEREKDEMHIKNKKLLKLVERYKRELNETRIECSELKARLLEGAQLKHRTMEQEQELDVLESKVGQLERVRQKQAHKIAGLQGSIEDTSQRFDEKRTQVANTVEALTSELRTTKMALTEITNRERQLLDLRSVIARMLGMNVTNLAVPDYEIISRLEKLILANQANVTTAVVLDTALEDMEDGFKAGYSDAARVIATRHGLAASGKRVTTSTSRSASLTRSRTRPRSASPSRKRDNRVY